MANDISDFSKSTLDATCIVKAFADFDSVSIADEKRYPLASFSFTESCIGLPSS